MTGLILPLKLALTENPGPDYRFAQQIGIPQSRLSQIVHGATEAKPQERQKISQALGKPENELFPASKR